MKQYINSITKKNTKYTSIKCLRKNQQKVVIKKLNIKEKRNRWCLTPNNSNLPSKAESSSNLILIKTTFTVLFQTNSQHNGLKPNQFFYVYKRLLKHKYFIIKNIFHQQYLRKIQNYKNTIFLYQRIYFFICQKYNNLLFQYWLMQPLHRLFGKELTNIIDEKHHHQNKNKSLVPQITRQNRGLSYQQLKPKLIKKSSNQSAHSTSHDPKKQSSTQQKMQNIQMVPDYIEASISHMLSLQDKQYNLVDYMSEQKQIKANMRGILVDWLVDLHLRFKMFPQTLFTVVMIIDKYLMKKQMSKQNLQLLGATAFFIAAKYEQTYNVPEVKQLVHLSANAFSKNDLLRLEADILLTLDFNLIMNNTMKFMEPFVRLIQMSPKNIHLTQYILQLSLLDMGFLKYKPSLLAAASVYLVNKIRRVQQIWPDILVGITGYEQKDVKSCAKQLCLMFQNVDKMSNTKCLKRKFSLPKFSEVSKIRLQRRQN